MKTSPTFLERISYTISQLHELFIKNLYSENFISFLVIYYHYYVLLSFSHIRFNDVTRKGI